MLDSLTLFDI